MPEDEYRSNWKIYDRETRRVGWRAGVLVIVVVVFCVLLGLGLAGVKWVTAPFRGAVDQREKTVADGDYRIAAYDEFFNSCEAIAAKERIISRYKDEQAAAATEADRVRLGAAILAESNIRDEMIADYNADAGKAGTRGQFRASELPFKIDPEGTTVCQ